MSSDAFTKLDLHHAATTMADILNEHLIHPNDSVDTADVLAALNQLGMTLTPDPTNQARATANTR